MASSPPAISPRGLAGAACPARRARVARRRAKAAAACQREVLPLDPALVEGARLVVDGLFGAGLARPVDGVARIRSRRSPAPRCPWWRSTFPRGARRQRCGARRRGARHADGHVPPRQARSLPAAGPRPCGRAGGRRHRHTRAGDGRSGRLFASHPRLWRALLPRRTSTSHKYAHGHALVLGGGMASSGAARWPPARRCARAPDWSRWSARRTRSRSTPRS